MAASLRDLYGVGPAQRIGMRQRGNVVGALEISHRDDEFQLVQKGHFILLHRMDTSKCERERGQGLADCPGGLSTASARIDGWRQGQSSMRAHRNLIAHKSY